MDIHTNFTMETKSEVHDEDGFAECPCTLDISMFFLLTQEFSSCKTHALIKITAQLSGSIIICCG